MMTKAQSEYHGPKSMWLANTIVGARSSIQTTQKSLLRRNGLSISCIVSDVLRSPIRRVFQPLLFDFRVVFPDDGTGARVNQLERVEDVVACACLRARG